MGSIGHLSYLSVVTDPREVSAPSAPPSLLALQVCFNPRVGPVHGNRTITRECGVIT